MINNSGSSWAIWDFHVHTPYSLLNNQFGDPEKEQTWTDYLHELDKVTKEKNIVALGITDYFCIEGYKKIVSEREKAIKIAQESRSEDYLLKNVYLFPNIEFRILPVTGKGKSINLHVLFNPSVFDIIEADFLSNLEFASPNKKYKCTKADLILLGQYINKKPTGNNNDLKTGMNQFKTSIEDVKAALECNSRFHKNALIGISNNSNDGLSGIAENALLATRLNICYHSDFILSPRNTDRDFFLGKDSRCNLETLTKNYNGPKPCLHGSDAHTLKSLCSPSEEKFCWVKAKPFWEGLLQVLYEPEDRVVIQKENPNKIKNNFSIRNISIPETSFNNDLKLDQIDQPINPNLVAIIGGRGSGKTALLDILASCFPEGSKLFSVNHSSSFVQRTLSKNAKGRVIENFPVTIQFFSGEKFVAIIGEKCDHFQNADIDYLTQNHFEDISANTTGLHDYILNLFFTEFPEEKVKYFAFEEKIQNYQDSINESILRMVTLKRNIESNLPSVKAEEQEKIGELQDYKLRIDSLENQDSEDIKTNVKEISELMAYFEKERMNTQFIGTQLKSISTIVGEFLNEYEELVNSYNESIMGEPSYSELDFRKPSFTQIREVLGDNILVSIAEELGFTGVINALKEDLLLFEGIEQELALYYSKRKEIQIELDQIRTKIRAHINDEKKVSDLKQLINKSFLAIVEEVQKQRDFLDEIIARFDSINNETLGSVSFVNTISSSKDTFLERLSDDVNLIKSKSQIEIISNLYDAITIAMQSNKDPAPFVSQISELAFNVELKRSVNRETFIMHIFERSFYNRLQACLNRKPLESLSMGERAVVLLKIVLSLGDKPLLIDQPEEHLDNRYVYSELVPTIRNIRKKRQVIIATHNANLVVNTDAEQIIVADYSDGAIHYTSGALEDAEIRESIKSILEGGDEAFKKREQKYNLS